MNIFVGNLLFEAAEGDVKKLFEGYGFVASVAIVMRKEKKTPKSRGFGFVQMPDEQQALAAIAALNGKEFMGRILDVNPARSNPTGIALPISIKEGPKAEAQAVVELKDKRQPEVTVEAEQYPREEREQKKTWLSPVYNKHLALEDRQVRPTGRHLALKDRQVRPSGRPGTYKSGRRTRSYMKRLGLTGMQEEAKPRRRSQDNPMRWRKKKYQAKPWQKSPGEHKPWEKAEEGARPWKKTEGESKPWRKSEGGIKPWKKPAGDAKPWKKPARDAKPWKKPARDAKPWKKPAGDAKPWSKSSERPQKSRFNSSNSLGMVRENGERSRTKGRKNPGGYKKR